MARLRSSRLRRSVQPSTAAPWMGWLLALLFVGAVGVIFLGGALFGLAGVVGVLSLPDAPDPAHEPAPILLVLPNEGLPAPDPAAPSPASLDTLVDVPVPADAPAPAIPTIAPSADAGIASPATAAPATATAISEETAFTYRALFEEIGASYGIDWRLLAAIAYRESRLDPLAVGRDGDLGLMQILPSTWNEFAPAVPGADPFDVRSNTAVAAAYLVYLQEYLHTLGHGEIYWLLVAYNWGPNNVRRLLANGGEWDQVPERQRQYAADILEMAFGARAEQ